MEGHHRQESPPETPLRSSFHSSPHITPWTVTSAAWDSNLDPLSLRLEQIGGGEGVAVGGGHARLPSTDSGIQADAGFDSLSRSYHKSLAKVR